MMGAYIAGQGVPCQSCGQKIRVGAHVYYVGPRIQDDGRTCASCVDHDLFGAVA